MTDKKIRNRFPASAFDDCKDIKSLTAKEKAAIVADWERFVVRRLNMSRAELDKLPGTDYGVKGPSQWTKRLYKAFSLYFGHIAHYDQHGFFAAQMQDWNDFRRNLREAAMQDMNHYNTWGAYSDAGDLNAAMGKVAEEYYAW